MTDKKKAREGGYLNPTTPGPKKIVNELDNSSQSARATAIRSAAAELEQIANNLENWAKKHHAKYVDPNGVKPPAFTFAQIEGWVNIYLSKQRLVAVFFSHPHLSYDVNSGLTPFLTTYERKEFHLIIDVFRLHMPSIATSLKELYDEFWEDVRYHIKCHERSKKVQQENIPSIGESIENTFWHPPLFLDGTVVSTVKRLRHIAKIAKGNLATSGPTETGQGNKDAKSEGEGGFIDNTKPTIKKLLSKNFIKATIKHFPYCGSYLFDVIYGVDGMKEQKEKTNPSIIPRDNIDGTTPKPKKGKGGWGKKIGVALFGLAAIASILAVLFGDNILGRISKKFKSNKPTVKQIEMLNVPDDLVDVNGVVFETRPTAYEIIEEIKELPVYERDAAAENYEGRMFKWSLRFKSLGPKEPEMRYVICEASPVRGEVVFYINADAKENLKIKKAMEGVFFDVSGEVERISLVREPQIKLKNVRLEFFY